MKKIQKKEKAIEHRKEETVFINETVVVNELVPFFYDEEDSMKKIADISEQFLQTMEPILCMYNAAMNAMTSRIDIIKDEFSFRNIRCPIHHIDTRLKSVSSILGKLEKKDYNLTLSAACNNIYDIAGVRVICPYIKDVYMIRDRIRAQDDLRIMEIKDYIEQPKRNGYRSLHMIIRVPVYFMNKKQMVPVELQLRTQAMDLWASLEHDIKYKAINKGEGIDFTAMLYECSELIYQAEEKLEAMNEVLEETSY